MNTNFPEIFRAMDAKSRYYIFIGILVLALLLDYLILMKPQLAALAKILPEVKILRQDIQKAREDIQKLDSYQKEVARLKNGITQAHQQIKSKEDVPLILERISRLANQNGVKIDQIMPFNQGQEVLLEDNQRVYFSLPILLEARSGYHDLGRFLNQLENDDISVNVSTFTIGAGSDTRYHVVKLNFEAIVFEEGKP